MSDCRPTVTKPDDDPHLWLDDIDGEKALAWVEGQNQRTLEPFENKALDRDYEELKAALDRPDTLPRICRLGGLLYNYWTDEMHHCGIWRRTTLERFRAGEEAWEELLDLDAIAKAEDEDWFWDGVTTLPPLHERAILPLSRGGSDAVVLREWNLATRSFVENSFALGEAKRDVATLARALNLAPNSGVKTVFVFRKSIPRIAY